MRTLLILSALSGAVVLADPHAALASPDSPGPCAARLQQLGYSRVKLDAVAAETSIYEARRGREEVKVMVQNGSCAAKQVWLDD